jgi:hypothetical protein
MSNHAAVTVLRPRGELERLWNSPDTARGTSSRGAVRFADAPGDRGTEIHLDLPKGGLLNRLIGAARRARGTRCATRYERIRNGDIDPSFVVTHRLDLGKAPDAYETFKHKLEECVKVVLKP